MSSLAGPIALLDERMYDLAPDPAEFEAFELDAQRGIDALDAAAGTDLAGAAAGVDIPWRQALTDPLDAARVALAQIPPAPAGSELDGALAEAPGVDQLIIDATAETPAEAWADVPVPYAPPPDPGFDPLPDGTDPLPGLPPIPGSARAVVTLQNVTRPGAVDFTVGEVFLLEAFGAPNAEVRVTVWVNGNDLGTSVYGQTDAAGRFGLADKLDARHVGEWIELWEVGADICEPILRFTVFDQIALSLAFSVGDALPPAQLRRTPITVRPGAGLPPPPLAPGGHGPAPRPPAPPGAVQRLTDLRVTLPHVGLQPWPWIWQFRPQSAADRNLLLGLAQQLLSPGLSPTDLDNLARDVARIPRLAVLVGITPFAAPPGLVTLAAPSSTPTPGPAPAVPSAHLAAAATQQAIQVGIGTAATLISPAQLSAAAARLNALRVPVPHGGQNPFPLIQALNPQTQADVNMLMGLFQQLNTPDLSQTDLENLARDVAQNGRLAQLTGIATPTTSSGP